MNFRVFIKNNKLLKAIFYKIREIVSYFKYINDFNSFRVKSVNKRFPTTWKDHYPCLKDNTKNTTFDAHYIYHPAWAARVLAKIKPSKHIDVSSILSFSTQLSAFIPMEFYDYRPANVKLSDFVVKHADLTALPFESNSVESLSCMHTLEHIGLGRYGDNLDPDGDLKAITELIRVLSPNGSLLIVVPIGKPMVRFNAHRIYSYRQIREYFKGLSLCEFSLIPDNANDGPVFNAPEELADQQKYGCGCFWFKKI
jgi:SAM-dependent methyltransferase